MIRSLIFIFTLAVAVSALAQKKPPVITKFKSDSNIAFTGTRITERDDEYDSTGSFQISGYISAYYAGYSDTAGADGFQKFPTSAPRSESFGLNMAMLSVKYTSHRFRGVTSLHFGDIPKSAWSTEFNAIQEANLGFRIAKGLWFDAGFFRTHIGLESIQPRENVTMSISVATYYEPYFLSGAKLSYTGLEKFTFQLNAFNSYNGFVENNRNKALGASVVYHLNDFADLTVNYLTCDEYPEGDGVHQRHYLNSYFTLRHHNWSIGVDLNYAIQSNSGLADSTASASMFSGVFAAKYRIIRTFAVYGRVSYFEDRDAMLTGPIENANHEIVGLDLLGTTLGFEFKPIANSYLRFEGRLLQTVAEDSIFYPYNGNNHQRAEIISGLGVWF